jgi:hypothetical protein
MRLFVAVLVLAAGCGQPTTTAEKRDALTACMDEVVKQCAKPCADTLKACAAIRQACTDKVTKDCR